MVAKKKRTKPTPTEIKIGNFVRAVIVRSNHLDPKKGIGWIASDVVVQVERVYDFTFCFIFGGELHYELQSECKPVKMQTGSLFSEETKICYMKDSIEYRLSLEYME
jgi:hypothetical protein